MFDPNATGSSKNGIFSLPYSKDEAELILLPVPWEVTTSYGLGTSSGPETILQASRQLDLCDALFGDFYKRGIFMERVSKDWFSKSHDLKEKALSVRDKLESGEDLTKKEIEIIESINRESQQLNQWVYDQAQSILSQGKFCAVIGGDHSSPFGLIKALNEKHSSLSVLQIDAHLDLRKSYQGFEYSHASIMRNVVEKLEPASLVQIGIRDFCPEEKDFSASQKNIHSFYDSETKLQLNKGQSWESLCQEILSPLSNEVYVSFDVDGMEPSLCPNTGTPVPGGLNYGQIESLLYFLVESGRKVVGFDLCEVSPGNTPKGEDCWDGNVGSRLLFKLCGALFSSNKSS